jgi:NTE family protein
MKINIINNLLTKVGINEPDFGIAFSGGGARGFSHIGVVLALEKYGLKASVVSGVSAGAVAAAMYGCGLSGRDMIDCFQDYVKLSDYAEWVVPKSSFMSIKRFYKLLSSWLPIDNIEDAKIPTVICATDIDNGKSVGFTSGNFAKKVMASCSIPVMFPPVKIKGVHYVDGGVLRNLPAWAIRDKCKILIGSNCSPLSRNYKHKDSLLNTALRTYSLISKSNTLQDLNLCDFVIQNPNLSRYKTFDVKEMKKIVIEGYDTACPIIEQMLNKI